jgi:hypothetical protein
MLALVGLAADVYRGKLRHAEADGAWCHTVTGLLPLTSVRSGGAGPPGLARRLDYVTEGSVPSTTLSKITAGLAGVTGTSSAGISVFAVLRMTQAHAVPPVAWIALVASAVTTVLLGGLGLVLEFKLRKLDAVARHAEAQSEAELKKIRFEAHRVLLEKAAGEPQNAQSYRDLILADALYLSVEQNGTQPADKTHGQLYSTGP